MDGRRPTQVFVLGFVQRDVVAGAEPRPSALNSLNDARLRLRDNLDCPEMR